MKRKILGLALLLLFGGSVAAFSNVQDRFDALAKRYALREEARIEASELRGELLAEADSAAPYALWRSLVSGSLSPRKTAANSLALMNALIKEGDPAQWETVSGLFYPSLTPKPLAAADAVFLGSFALLAMDERGADALALQIMERFAESSMAKHHFLTTAPVEFEAFKKAMEERKLLPVYGRWSDSRYIGHLPFASSIGGSVSYGRALSEDMVFLNNAGQPASNGSYAWDRVRGRIYTVRSERDRRIWYPGD
ncbi:MAG: hypothetical protein GX791_00200 [Synergistaceae bacterium]|nr:hypothetical protein [Synergistaceae bacterium]